MVSLFNNHTGGAEAEIWINGQEGRAFTSNYGGFYGKYQGRINLYYANDIDRTLLQQPPNFEIQPEWYSYGVAHEMVHHLWRVFDEYVGSDCCLRSITKGNLCEGENVCDCEPFPGSDNASFCLMDNYYNRGGNFDFVPAGTGEFTLNELCIAPNHDPDGDTSQDQSHDEACWQTIAQHGLRPLDPPDGFPDNAPPSVEPPIFQVLPCPKSDGHYIISLDQTPSKDTLDGGDGASRLDRAKQAAHVFINGARGGNRLGAISFATTPVTVFPLTEISLTTEEVSKSAFRDAIDQVTTACCTTATGLALGEGQQQLAGQAPQSCRSRLVLFADGSGSSVIAARRGHTSQANPATVFDFALLGPDGSLITESGADTNPDVDFFGGSLQKVFRVRNTLAGDWGFTKSIVAGGATSYDFIAVATSTAITMTAMALEPVSPCGVPRRPRLRRPGRRGRHAQAARQLDGAGVTGRCPREESPRACDPCLGAQRTASQRPRGIGRPGNRPHCRCGPFTITSRTTMPSGFSIVLQFWTNATGIREIILRRTWRSWNGTTMSTSRSTTQRSRRSPQAQRSLLSKR